MRVIDTRHDPAANAVFTGFGPGPKYVFVTDRLLETFSDDQRAAVLAHEVGHRKKNHIAIKLGTHLGTIVVIAAAVAGLIYITPDAVPASVAAVLVPVLLVSSILVVQGTLGVRLERQADDYAAATVGAAPLQDALTKIADLNMLKRRTGWF